MKKPSIRQTNLYDEAQKRLEELERLRNYVEKELLCSPLGKIHLVKSEKRVQFYLRTDPKDKSGKYIPKSDLSTITTFLQKSYNDKLLRLINKEIASLEHFLKASNFREEIRSLYSSHPDQIKQFITPVDMSDEDYALWWTSQPFRGLPMQEGVPGYISNKGEQVRSKSELIIANALFRSNIPYRYEAPFVMRNGAVVYPDFTVLDVTNRKEFYWEHRGMMDDAGYARKNVPKLRDYMMSGVFPGENLIITEETSLDPLGSREINCVIEHYFGARH